MGVPTTHPVRERPDGSEREAEPRELTYLGGGTASNGCGRAMPQIRATDKYRGAEGCKADVHLHSQGRPCAKPHTKIFYAEPIPRVDRRKEASL